jgi:hypothetical protein
MSDNDSDNDSELERELEGDIDAHGMLSPLSCDDLFDT